MQKVDRKLSELESGLAKLGKFGERAQGPLCPVELGLRNRLCVSTCLVQPEGNSDLAIVLHLRKRKKGQNKTTNTSLCELCQL